MMQAVKTNEKLDRPEVLVGSTYKIKTPLSDSSIYVTINDIILNPGTVQEVRKPFEIFINTKTMDNFQWTVALTRVISAVFRNGGDITYLVEELRSVFDPKGGYLKAGGKYVPSLVAEIGDAIEIHLKTIGMIPDREMDDEQKKYLEKKKAEFESKQAASAAVTAAASQNASGFPAGAALCPKCNVTAVVRIDNCATCLNCGDSKCG